MATSLSLGSGELDRITAPLNAAHGAIALRALDEHAGDAATLSRVFETSAPLAERVHARVRTKLQTEPVEDFRIDFEDGYGVRGGGEEDGHALTGGDRRGPVANAPGRSLG